MASVLRKKIPSPTPVTRMVEDVLGCKWSMTVLALIAGGVTRPGAMQRQVQGLTAKVLNERLRKLLRYGVIEREVFAEVPPHVEYRLTEFGRRFNGIIEQIAALESRRNARYFKPSL